MRLLDLFCGAGGAAMGYHRAGFEVVGVDIKPQPRYPFDFVQADALTALERRWAGYSLEKFDVIHASPPCQRWTLAQNASKNAAAHPDHLTPIREILLGLGTPFVIENVVGSPLRDPIRLCGTSFGLVLDGFELRRHRLFEIGFGPLILTPPCVHQFPAAPVFGHSAGRDWRRRFNRDFGAADKAAIMGIDWMNRNEVSEAVPPAFTQFIGERLIEYLTAESPELADEVLL